MKPGIVIKVLTFVVFFLFCNPLSSGAYAVLTHEAIVDACWESAFQPLLKKKYPLVTEEQLKEAHAYAYGGAIAPDMGYFPFGSKLFTNLLHYVRSGDFVNSLLDEAQDANEYAFALGSLCHYMSDKYGHFLGTNQCVPIVYPKMKKKFGDHVTYEEDHISHKRMEFCFDVLQTAKGNYASETYHDFIGFKVSRPVLERAFLKTYGLDINQVFGNLTLSIETFRWSVNSLFPELTKAAWLIKKNEILKTRPTATSRNFRYKMNRANYYQEYGKKHQRPGIFLSAFSFVIRVLPKVGPLRSLKLKAPGPEAEKLFIQSFDAVLLNCKLAMQTLKIGNMPFDNIDFDTGNKTLQGEYKMADINYGNLVLKLSDDKFNAVSADLKFNILSFYKSPPPINTCKKLSGENRKIIRALEALKTTSVLNNKN